MEAISAGRPMHLALPASALGLGGALIAADFLRVGCSPHDDRLGLLLVTVIPASATAIGFVFAPRASGARLTPLVACATATCICGALLGTIIGGTVWGGVGASMGLADGLGFGAAFALALVSVGAAVQRTGRARPASVVDASDRLLVAGIVASVLGVAAGLTRLWRAALPACPADSIPTPILGVISAATLLVIVTLQARRLGRVSAVLAGTQPADGTPLPPRLPCVDLGVGDDVGAEWGAGEGTAYRDRPAAVRATHGSVSFARRALGRAMVLEWAMFVAALGGCALAAR
jgi:hypothetical protein